MIRRQKPWTTGDALILLILAGVALIYLILYGDSEPRTISPTKILLSSTATVSQGRIGDTMQSGGITFRVERVRRVDPRTLPVLYQRQAGRIYLVIHVFLKNGGISEGLALDDDQTFSLINSHRSSYQRAESPMITAEVASEPDIYRAPSWDGRPPEIEPGESARGA